MHFDTYREFYPKSLILMGEKDRAAMNDPESKLTHWLVSLEGIPRLNEEYYLWVVSIYPADIEGTFNWNTPLYKSMRFDDFDEAYEEALRLEVACRDPRISMINYVE